MWFWCCLGQILNIGQIIKFDRKGIFIVTSQANETNKFQFWTKSIDLHRGLGHLNFQRLAFSSAVLAATKQVGQYKPR